MLNTLRKQLTAVCKNRNSIPSLFSDINIMATTLGILIRDFKMVSSVKEEFWNVLSNSERKQLETILKQKRALSEKQLKLIFSFRHRALNRIAQGRRAE